VNLPPGVISLGFDPTLSLGPLDLRWQTIGVLVGLLIALGVVTALARGRGLTIEQLLLILVGIVPGAVVGGRVMHVLDYAGAYAAQPLSAFDPAVGSLSLTGAILGGTASALYVIRLLRTRADDWAAVAAVPLLVALAVGKLGQLLGGAGQGTAFDGAWAVSFVGGGPWVSFAPAVPSHPSQVYEALWLAVGIGVVHYLAVARREDSGTMLFVGAIAWFMAGRLLVGFTWRDPRVVGPLNMEQLVALVILTVGGSYLFVRSGRFARQVALALCVTLVAGCGTTTSPNPTTASTPAPTPTRAPTPAPSPTPAAVDQLIAQMTLDEKVGQLFMVKFYGDEAAETDAGQRKLNRAVLGAGDIATAIERYHLGGVVYFSVTGNLRSAAQIASLSNAVQTAAAAQSPSIPLLVATDQEGGSIVRLPAPATGFAGNMALGATNSTTLARTAGRVMGQELRALGINQVFAPDGDVNVDPANPIIGLRSFGADPTAVGTLTAAMVRGFQADAGVGATVKHFPGHGDTDIDSHSQLPIINHSTTQWASLDQPPFSAAIAAGVDAVMVGHLAFPALDPSGTPSSLSAAMVNDVLRGQMGYDGLVVTDSLEMGALRDSYGDARIPVMAELAGDDMLLMPPSLPVAWNAVKAAVQSGEIPMSRLNDALRHILTLKQRLGLFGATPVSVTAANGALGTKAHRTAEQRVAEASLTLVANDGSVLPIGVATAAGPYRGVGPAGAAASVATLASLLRGRGLTVTTYVGTSPPDAADFGTVIDLTLNADTDVGQQRVVRALAATGTRLVTVAIGRPYDQGYYRAAVNVCLYSSSAASLRALVRALFGEIAPSGHLPVAIPDASEPGTTLYPIGYGLGY
jgi:beta-N-acetylhexosaminidase